MKLEDLVACLKELGLKYETRTNAAGGTVIALERGGRIIGLYPSSDQPNMLWTNPVLADRSASRELFGRANHWNIGGERVWLSPEREYHVMALEPSVRYTVQQSIDPGAYRFEGSEQGERSGSIAWRQEGVARQYRSGRNVGFKLAKSIRLTDDPLRYASDVCTGDYRFIGYEASVALETEEDRDILSLSSWSVIQVPAGGYAYAPTYGECRPTDLFAPTGSSRLTVNQGMVRFKMDAKASHKLSLKSWQTTGRFGYFRQDDRGLCSLIVRTILPDPSSDYLDTPWGDPDDRGHCVQLYNDDGKIGLFGELEHHAPAATRSPEQGWLVGRDRSQLWCYSGSFETIARIGGKLLGADISIPT
ncbi:DUF6786 family protein [Paenibacillaceae bacterium WGS1546]|uniref:DUF6786 family protein n=1 Tax=Cohnella sp. WGS1546 TaxID=3366810 RepID=UPI00372D2103